MIKPMLATPVAEPFNRPGWIFEIKWDGFRAIAEISKRRVELYSRNGLSFNGRFPEIVDELAKIRGDVILDGEIVGLDERGRPKFQLLQNAHRHEAYVIYYAFDILRLNRRDLTELPLLERKEILSSILPNSRRLRFSDHIETRGKVFFNKIEKAGLEGIIAKNAGSPYRAGVRSRDWLKIKTSLRQEAIIAGFTAPKGSRKYFGSLILGLFKKGKLIYIGSSGGGFDQTVLRELHSRMQPIAASPLSNPPRIAGVTWVQPKLVCEVAFTEWTKDGRMRHPVYLGLREDKNPREVKKEAASDFYDPRISSAHRP